MADLFTVLGALSIVVAGVLVIILIIQAIRRRPVKKIGVTLAGFFTFGLVSLIAFGANGGIDVETGSTTQNTIAKAQVAYTSSTTAASEQSPAQTTLPQQIPTPLPAEPSQTPASTSVPTPTPVPIPQNSYQSILDDYSARLRAATPGLIDEYNSEAAVNTGGLEGLATIMNNKVTILAEISNEGVGEMAELYFKMGSGKYSEYEEWAGKLYEVYMEEAGKITEVYMNSAT